MARGSAYIRAKSLIARSGGVTLFVVLALMIPTVSISYALNEDKPYDHKSWDNIVAYFTSGDWWKYLLTVWVCTIISSLIVYLVAVRNEHRQVLRLFSGDNDIPIFTIIGISAIIVTLLVFVSHVDLDNARMHAGGVFDIAIGIFSIAGIWLTLREVLDIHNSIVSFQDLMNRIEDLIKTTPDGEVIELMVLTPAMGCMVLPDRKWHRLVNTIRQPEYNISLTCLEENDMEEWLRCYTFDNDPAEVQHTKNTLREAGIKSSNRTLELLTEQAKDLGHELPLTGKFNDLSSTYMVSNGNKAIVAVPLYLPTPQYKPKWHDHDKRRVQFIGFETKDLHVVESIHEEIRLRRDFIMNKVVEPAEIGASVTSPTGAAVLPESVATSGRQTTGVTP